MKKKWIVVLSVATATAGALIFLKKYTDLLPFSREWQKEFLEED